MPCEQGNYDYCNYMNPITTSEINHQPRISQPEQSWRFKKNRKQMQELDITLLSEDSYIQLKNISYLKN